MKKQSDPIHESIWSELFPKGKPDRAQARQVQIAQEALRLFASRGVEETNYEQIAKASKVTRTLVQHYFPTREELAWFLMRFIRAQFQKECVDAILKESSGKNQLLAYLNATFDWIERRSDHAKVWLLFYYYAGVRSGFRKANTEFVHTGCDRIERLLQRCSEEGSVATMASPQEARLRAKLLQNALTGGLVCAMTEEQDAKMSGIRRVTIASCMRLAVEGVSSLIID